MFQMSRTPQDTANRAHYLRNVTVRMAGARAQEAADRSTNDWEAAMAQSRADELAKAYERREEARREEMRRQREEREKKEAEDRRQREDDRRAAEIRSGRREPWNKHG